MGSLIRLNGRAPRCPLCQEFMQQHYVEDRHMFVWACDLDRVAISTTDPMVGKWDAALARSGKVECPACNADMRVFTTSIGYMKAKCIKKSCGATLANSEPDRVKEVTA